MTIYGADRQAFTFAVDEHSRRNSSLETLATPKPLHSEIPGFAITAGNASGIDDGVPDERHCVIAPFDEVDGIAQRVTVTLTRDSVCMGDDIEAPHADTLIVPAGTDAAALARAILTANYLAHVGSTATWAIGMEDAFVVFGRRHGLDFVRPVRSGEPPWRVTGPVVVHVRYHAQRDPAGLA